MLTTLVMLGALATGQCYTGQCYTTPVREEVHYIQNTGPVNSKFYVWVELPNGHKTTVPVVNGILPLVTYDYVNGVTLVCDYSHGIEYVARHGVIRYEKTDLKGGGAPAPRHPDRKPDIKVEELRGGLVPQSPKVPSDGMLDKKGGNALNMPVAPKVKDDASLMYLPSQVINKGEVRPRY